MRVGEKDESPPMGAATRRARKNVLRCALGRMDTVSIERQCSNAAAGASLTLPWNDDDRFSQVGESGP